MSDVVRFVLAQPKGFSLALTRGKHRFSTLLLSKFYFVGARNQSLPLKKKSLVFAFGLSVKEALSPFLVLLKKVKKTYL